MTRAQATARFAAMSEDRKAALSKTVVAGLPGRMVESYTLEQFQKTLDAYKSIDDVILRENLVHFLQAVVPVAASARVLLAIHPDDPPMPLLGLPRVVSTDSDLDHILSAVDSVHNGLTFCAGSFASTAKNDVVAMAAKHAPRTHFVHLRNVQKSESGSFVESDHLDGDVDMFNVVRTFMLERNRRSEVGWEDSGLPFRPDHGHKMVDDLRGKTTNPGYSCIGRLRGLAELRGLQEGILRAEGLANGERACKAQHTM